MRNRYYEDGTITYYSIFLSRWVKNARIVPHRELAAMSPRVRARVIEHTTPKDVWNRFDPTDDSSWPPGPTTHRVRVRNTGNTHAEYYARFYPAGGQWLLRDTGAFLHEVDGWKP